jgi:hypothetical protein
MRDIRKRPFRSPPQWIPVELSGKRVLCAKCLTSTPIPWVEKQKFPAQPVAPNAGGGHWVPASISVACARCTEISLVPVPRLRTEGRWSLYGDEAARQLKNPDRHFFCITLVGLHREKREVVETEITTLKSNIRPDRDPSTWALHFTEIWGDRKEKFSFGSTHDKIVFANDFSNLIHKARPELFTMNVSSVIEVPTIKNERARRIRKLHQDVFTLSLLSSLQQFRKRKLALSWIFDSIRDTTGGERTEGWAEEVFLGLQYTPLFTWLSAGATILAPQFAKPGSHFLAEIADFISYGVAREFQKKVENTEPEFSTSGFGMGFYQSIRPDGSVDFEWSNGLPFAGFYSESGRGRS